ncbi:MAG TPA: isocitrate/isopropylmalate family dehydrogenase, partial [Gemmatimonadaceae bacterium]
MAIPITLIPGDGIGPEITDATVRVLEHTGLDLAWERAAAGAAAAVEHGDPLPAATIESIERTRVALKGPLATPVGEGYRSVNVSLRVRFDLFANVRPAHTMRPGG